MHCKHRSGLRAAECHGEWCEKRFLLVAFIALAGCEGRCRSIPARSPRILPQLIYILLQEHTPTVERIEVEDF